MSTADEWNNWRASRVAKVTGPTGNLALIETRWQDGGSEISLEEALGGQPSTVQVTREQRKDFNGKVVATGIRLWDSNSPSIQAFQSIDAYPYDPHWVLKAKFIPHSAAQPVPFEFVKDNGGTRDLAVPGEIQITIEGVEYTLHAFDDEGTLILVFADPTNGVESYAAGRFLFVTREAGTDEVIIDFNRAFVPPCGFSFSYNCPLPPTQNRIHIAIRAGEKNPVFRNGYHIH